MDIITVIAEAMIYLVILLFFVVIATILSKKIKNYQKSKNIKPPELSGDIGKDLLISKETEEEKEPKKTEKKNVKKSSAELKFDKKAPKDFLKDTAEDRLTKTSPSISKIKRESHYPEVEKKPEQPLRSPRFQVLNSGMKKPKTGDN